MADPNEAGGWVIDPSNPNRATYTDEDGQVHEAFRDAPATPQAPTAAPSPQAPQPQAQGAAPTQPTQPNQVVPPEQARGAWQRLTDSFNEAGQHGFPGWVARKWYDWTDYGVNDLMARGMTREQAEAKADELIATAQRGLQEEMAAKQAQDPNWRPDQSFWQAAGDVERWGPWLAGQVLGSAGPESFVNPGGTAGRRVAAQAAMGALSDAAYQGAEIWDGVKEQFDELQMLGSAAAGAGLQTVFEIPGFVRNLFKGRGGDTTPHGNPLDTPERAPSPDAPSDIQVPRMSPQEEQAYGQLLENGSVQDILGFFNERQGFSVNPEQVTRYVQAREQGRAAAAAVVYANPDASPLERQLAEEANQFQQGRQPQASPEEHGLPAARPAEAIQADVNTQRVNNAVDRINEITADWQNAPQFEVHENFDQFPDIDPDAIGVTTPEGKVLINMQNVDSPSVLSAVTFHEGLGHHGLTQRFGEDLDGLLDDLYYNSKGDFANKVDEWMANNPDAYADDANPVGRAAEEVLAEMSESGRIDRSIMDRIKDTLKRYGREMGIDLKYSDREIRSILAMAHNATINGHAGDASANGFRYKLDDAQARRRQQIMAATEAVSGGRPGETKFTQPFPEEEPDYFRFRHVGQNGEPVSGTYRINDEGNIESFSVGLGGKPNRLGAREVRDLARAIRRQHPEATTLEGMRITGGRKASGKGNEDVSINLLRYMKRKGIEPSKASQQDRIKLSAVNLVTPRKEAAGTFLNELGVYSPGELRKMSVEEVSQAAERLGIDQEWVDYFNDRRLGVKTPQPDMNKYLPKVRFMKRRAGKGSEAGTPQGGSRRDFREGETESNLGLGRIRSRENIEGILGENAPAPTRESWDEWIDTANSLRQTVRQSKNLDSGATPAQVLKAREHIIQSANRIAQLSRLAVDSNLSTREEYQLMAEIARNADLQDALAGVRSNAARIVNSFKIEVGTDKAFTDSIRNMMRVTDNTVFADPANRRKLFEQIAAAADNPRAVNRMVRDSLKPKAEDYIFRVWYNMLLSAPATHVANFVGTGGNFIADLLENTGASVVGQGKRFSNAERIRGREVAYRVIGALNALRTAQTWKNTREALNTGLTGNEANVKGGASNVYTGDNAAAGAASGFLESPTRALAGADEWWRNVLQLSNIYGLAVRNAGNKGLKGKAFRDEVANLIENPTKEMIQATNDYTRVIQFLDKPSAIGKAIIDLQTPKADSSVGGRAARGVLKAAVPFVRTPDALIRTAIRRAGPLGVFERENLRGWKAGGAERDKVKARLIMGSMLSFWLATQAYKGNITGEGPQDYQKKQEWLGSHQPNSIKIGDQWYSIAGLEPVSTNITGIATLVERLKNGEISQDDYGKSAIALAQGIGSVLTENSYLEGFNNLMDISDDDPNKAEHALTNFVANIASSATTPAILRKYTQSQDNAVRDTTGSGSLEDRLYGRIASAVPGLSDQLPQRYDVYGRPQERQNAGPDMFSRTQTRMAEDDPVIQELGRLAETTDKVLVGAPSKSNIKVNGVARRLTAEEFQDYQHLSGYWIVESLRQEMQNPEWQQLSDAEKIDTIKDIKNDMRAAAREYLFQTDEDDGEASE